MPVRHDECFPNCAAFDGDEHVARLTEFQTEVGDVVSFSKVLRRRRVTQRSHRHDAHASFRQCTLRRKAFRDSQDRDKIAKADFFEGRHRGDPRIACNLASASRLA